MPKICNRGRDILGLAFIDTLDRWLCIHFRLCTYAREYAADLGGPAAEGHQNADSGQDEQHAQDDLVDHQTQRQVDIVFNGICLRLIVVRVPRRELVAVNQAAQE